MIDVILIKKPYLPELSIFFIVVDRLFFYSFYLIYFALNFGHRLNTMDFCQQMCVFGFCWLCLFTYIVRRVVWETLLFGFQYCLTANTNNISTVCTQKNLIIHYRKITATRDDCLLITVATVFKVINLKFFQLHHALLCICYKIS